MLAKAIHLLIKALKSELEACSLVRWHSLTQGKVSRFLEKTWTAQIHASGLYLGASDSCKDG